MLIRAEDGTICIVANYNMIKIRGEATNCVVEAVCYNGQSSAGHSFHKATPGEHLDLTGPKIAAEAKLVLDRIIGSQGANVDLTEPSGAAPNAGTPANAASAAGWAPL